MNFIFENYNTFINYISSLSIDTITSAFYMTCIALPVFGVYCYISDMINKSVNNVDPIFLGKIGVANKFLQSLCTFIIFLIIASIVSFFN